MAFTFEVDDNSLIITNSTDLPPVRIALVHPIVELADDQIHVFDNFGQFMRTFRFHDFGTIAGVQPISMDDAYESLRVLQNQVNAATGGGSLPAGAATSANQEVEIDYLAQLNSKLPDLGPSNVANSVSVVLATDSVLPSTGVLSVVNSSVTPLGSGAVFTGTAEDITGYSEIKVAVFSNVSSATDGLSLQQSPDGVNWDILDIFTVPAGQGKTFGVGAAARFFRIVYTNGGSAQATFRLQTIFHRVATKPSTVRPQDGRSNDNDMEENLAFGMVYDPIGNVWNRLQTQDLFITGQGTQTAVGQNIVLATAGTGSTDCIAYRQIDIQINPTGTVTSGVVTFEGSNDNFASGNGVPIPLYDKANTSAVPMSTISPATGTPRFLSGPIEFRYFRARITTVIGGGGSLQAFTTLRQTALQPVTVKTISGVSALDALKQEESTHTTGDAGNFMLGVRSDTPASTSTATGRYSGTIMDSLGRTWVNAVYANTLNQNHSHLRTTALSSTAVAIKAAAGNLYGLNVINPNTVPVYLKLYNIAQGSVVVGTSTVLDTIMIPAGDGTTPGAVILTPDESSLYFFSTAISVAAVTGIADSSTAAPTTALIAKFIYA
jgi:hypothetical protein